jgi:2,5-diamino-6-(ribosylamino)-4(3H)-pyrimidinone 5'-phosphate reductase
MVERGPHVVVHLAVGLDATVRGFEADIGEYYGLVGTFREDVTLAGADTILAQEDALTSSPPGPGPDPDGALLAVVDSRERVTAWDALRDAGYWREVRPLRGRDGGHVDLRAALEDLAEEGAAVVRVDSGGRLVGALLREGLVDEVSLLVHPALGSGPPWTDGVGGVGFELTHHEPRGPGLLWLRYRVLPRASSQA